MNTKLENFVKYSLEHPEQRFWEALKSWSGVNAIYTSEKPIDRYDWAISPFTKHGYMEDEKDGE